MECPFVLEQPDCDFALECRVLTAALDEVEDLRTALNKEADSLRCRIRQLEDYILSAGLPLPPELRPTDNRALPVGNRACRQQGQIPVIP